MKFGCARSQRLHKIAREVSCLHLDRHWLLRTLRKAIATTRGVTRGASGAMVSIPQEFAAAVKTAAVSAPSAPEDQTRGRKAYSFESWSDRGARIHDIVAPATATTYVARF